MSITRTGTCERIRADESISVRACTTAQRSTRISQRNRVTQLRATQLSSSKAAQAAEICNSRGSGPIGDGPPPALYSSVSFLRWDWFRKEFGEPEHLRYRWQQAAKMPLHSLCENTAVFQACLLWLAWNWKQLDNFTRVQQQPQSSLLQISPVSSPSWITFRGKPLNLFY